VKPAVVVDVVPLATSAFKTSSVCQLAAASVLAMSVRRHRSVRAARSAVNREPRPVPVSGILLAGFGVLMAGDVSTACCGQDLMC
jgi:hypothetical protein